MVFSMVHYLSDIKTFELIMIPVSHTMLAFDVVTFIVYTCSPAFECNLLLLIQYKIRIPKSTSSC